MFVVHGTSPNKRKLENNAMSNYKISSSLYGGGFFPTREIFCIYFLKNEKKHIFKWNFILKNKSTKWFYFLSMYINIIHH
jgi:hypothetical protein